MKHTNKYIQMDTMESEILWSHISFGAVCFMLGFATSVLFALIVFMK